MTVLVHAQQHTYEVTYWPVHLWEGWLVGWSFNGTFSTKRLYRALQKL